LFLQETHLTDRNKHWLKLKGWEKIFQANGTPKQAEGAILISNKVDFKPTNRKRQRRSLHTNRRDNTSKGNNNY
jgi:hypothetical protein